MQETGAFWGFVRSALCDLTTLGVVLRAAMFRMCDWTRERVSNSPKAVFFRHGEVALCGWGRMFVGTKLEGMISRVRACRFRSAA